MSISAATILGFSDEMEKIALSFGQAVRAGWQNSGGLLGKALTGAGTVLGARDALRGEDPTGQGRSRFERMTGLIGGTFGGLAGTGMAAHLMPKSTILAPIVGGVAGQILGDKAVTMPLESRRNARAAESAQRELAGLRQGAWQ